MIDLMSFNRCLLPRPLEPLFRVPHSACSFLLPNTLSFGFQLEFEDLERACSSVTDDMLQTNQANSIKTTLETKLLSSCMLFWGHVRNHESSHLHYMFVARGSCWSHEDRLRGSMTCLVAALNIIVLGCLSSSESQCSNFINGTIKCWKCVKSSCRSLRWSHLRFGDLTFKRWQGKNEDFRKRN